MKFVDQVRLKVKGGDGGNGSIAFRREKYVPFGGPAGGDGARGGSVVFVADEGRTSLLDLGHVSLLRAKNGEHGRGKDQYGRAGLDLEVKVPVGTEVYDALTSEKILDLTEHGMRAVVAQGGEGGRGNKHFATPFDRAPRRAEPGSPGQERTIRLELKVLADVGLVGFPNVGKSTLVAAMSRARPRIADYPFTTLRPHLGVVKIGSRSSTASFVMADIPGLIPGASEGAGLGTRFLKHVERCKAILHLLAPPTDDSRGEGREPRADFEVIMGELRAFAPELAKRPTIVALSKADLPGTQELYEQLRKDFAKRGLQLRLISAVTGQGLPELANELYHLVHARKPEEDDGEAVLPPEPKTPAIAVKKKAAKAERPRPVASPSVKKKSAAKKAQPLPKRTAKPKGTKKAATSAKSKPTKRSAGTTSRPRSKT